MKAKLFGVQEIDFTNNNGERISGLNIFTGFQDTNVEGLRTEKFFVKEGVKLPKEVTLGDEIEISFNHKGKVEKLQKA